MALPVRPTLPPRVLGGFVIVFLLTVAGTEALPRTTHYASSNIVFRDIFRVLYDREARWRDADPMSMEDAISRYLTPAGETFVPVDPDYPLLRNTTGFTGPTHFDVDVPDTRPPHVVLLFMESFRSADIGTLGAAHRPSVTPTFDALAEEGVLYTQFYGSGVQTTRAVIAGLFGIPPRFSRRAVQSDDVDFPLVGIQDVFREAGYRAAYYHNGPLDFELQTEFFGAHGFQDIQGD
ncbi:MAG: sulfatase-like hydrolase/transferase, partial [Flavobacteriaceae bacterium]